MPYPDPVEAYASIALAIVLRQKELHIEPEMVVVTKMRDGYACSVVHPRGVVNPFARAFYIGNENGGNLQLLTFFDPKIKFWSNPGSWHHFDGPIYLLH